MQYLSFIDDTIVSYSDRIYPKQKEKKQMIEALRSLLQNNASSFQRLPADPEFYSIYKYNNKAFPDIADRTRIIILDNKRFRRDYFYIYKDKEESYNLTIKLDSDFKIISKDHNLLINDSNIIDYIKLYLELTDPCCSMYKPGIVSDKNDINVLYEGCRSVNYFNYGLVKTLVKPVAIQKISSFNGQNINGYTVDFFFIRKDTEKVFEEPDIALFKASITVSETGEILSFRDYRIATTLINSQKTEYGVFDYLFQGYPTNSR